MVCNRCIMAIETLLRSQFPKHQFLVTLGRIEVQPDLDSIDLNDLTLSLEKLGFELVDDEKGRKVEQIKQLIISEIHHQGNRKKQSETFSAFIGQELGHDYSYLNNLFSSIEGKTIGQYITLQKIEKAKELLVYEELSLEEIADQLEYNSAQYLSTQFKKLTGLTPSKFRSFGHRRPIDSI